MKKSLLLFIVIATILMNACKKSGVENPGIDTVPPLITTTGVVAGDKVEALIKANTGGTISSADGKMSIQIPAGALANDETIGIQPITNTAGFGSKLNYRITPHNITFTSPVTISFTYSGDDISATAPEMLRIGFQDNKGAWQAMSHVVLDKQVKKITTVTNHFSDWGFFPLCYIAPSTKTIHTGETLPLKVMYAINPEDAVFFPSNGTIPVTAPFALQNDYIKNWSSSGPGSLTGNGNSALYTAPSQVPSSKPVAVTAAINFREKGTYLLVANITIVGNVHIDYMQVDETEVNVQQINYVSRLFLYGNFGNDPGESNRSVKIGNVPLLISVWSPNIIICEIAAVGPSSSGYVKVSSGTESDTRLLNQWTVEFNYEKKESPDGSLTRKVAFALVLRGDALHYGNGETAPLLASTNLNKSSNAIINVNAGSFSNIVHNDGCGTYSVKWTAIKDYVINRSLYSSGGSFSGEVVQSASGFGVKLRLLSDNILRSERNYVACHGDGYQQIVFEPIEFAGHHEEVFHFRFTDNTEKAHIAAGAPVITTGTGVASGLYWDAEDLNSSLFTSTVSWKEAVPKYN